MATRIKNFYAGIAFKNTGMFMTYCHRFPNFNSFSEKRMGTAEMRCLLPRLKEFQYTSPIL